MKATVRALIICLFATGNFAYSQNSNRIVSVKSVLQRMEDGLQKLEDFQAAFTVVNGTYKSSGYMFYMKPFFFRMNSYTDGSKLVSDGKKIWLYVPIYGIIAEQELINSEKQYKLMLTTSRKSLNHLRRDYTFKFAPGGKSSKDYYILDLFPRVTKVGFKSIRLWVGKDSGLIFQIDAMTVNNTPVKIEFSKIKINQNLGRALFNFTMPDKNVQVIKNTIVPVDIFNKRRR